MRISSKAPDHDSMTVEKTERRSEMVAFPLEGERGADHLHGSKKQTDERSLKQAPKRDPPSALRRGTALWASSGVFHWLVRRVLILFRGRAFIHKTRTTTTANLLS